MKNLYIVGAGGCGRETLSMVLDIHQIQGPKWNIKGFLDDTENPLGGISCDYGVAGTIRDYSPKPDDVLAMAIASPSDKYELVSMLESRGACFESIIHPYSSLGRHCEIGRGALVFGGFGMTVNVKIGNFATLLASGIGHDVRVGDFCTISSHCNIMGHVRLGERVFIGGNVCIAPHVEVGDDAYVCMGSVLFKNAGKGCKVLGNPAREIG